MTQDNLPTDPPADSNASNRSTPDPAPKPVTPIRKRRWLRRILLAVLGLVIFLVILAAITPTLLSTGPGRTFVLGKINDNLNGHVTVTNWSIGWTGGIHADDVKVFDEHDRQILQIPRLSTQLSLLGAMRGKIHLGDTRVEGLDFYAERYSDGTLNFARLTKNAPASARHEGKENAANGEKENKTTKLPMIDGDIQLIGCRGTFQDDTNPDPKYARVDFRTITGEVKITGINDPIEDSLKVIAYGVDGGEMLNFSASGTMQIAGDNELLTPGQMKVTQKLVTAADLKHFQQGFGGMLPVAFTGGTLNATIDVATAANGVTVTPLVNGKDIGIVKDGVSDNVGAIYVDGSVNMTSPGGAAAKDAVTNVTFSKLRAMCSGAGSSVIVNGDIGDLLNQRKFNNLTIDVSYNSAMLWDMARVWLSKEQKESLKDVKVAGNHDEKFVINGSLPADKPFAEAIAGVTANGEFILDSFDGKGAALKNLVLPLRLAGGKAAIAYAGKTGDQQYPPPAELNGGKLSLAGATIDLTGKYPTLSCPDKMKFLDNVELNPPFTSTFLGGNPVFADAHKSSGKLSIEIARCDRFPLAAIMMQDVPENDGVIELNLVIHKLEIGNVLVAKIAGQLKATNLPFIKKLSMESLAGDIDDFNVLVQHGVSKQHLTLAFGGGKRPLKLAGSVTLATQMMDMQLDLPMALFGIKAGQDAGIKLPLTGPVDDPKFDLQAALKKNLTNIPGIPNNLKGLLNGADGATTQPDKDPLHSLINGLGKKKDK
ncbi:MAG TPA: hypothetical protein VFE47_14755 [Tepidisphaeraceae bacterium]|jgi:hypothetical protein|nr:hypothetical protein [Tepidisphaeraceae bacterium]